MTAKGEPLRLHIGGEAAKPGWKILNVQPNPGVDYIGDCCDLGVFPDGTVDEIYASHVLEHLGYADELPRALLEFHRVLKNGGKASISVPDFDLLCRLFLDAQQNLTDRILIMRMIFGGQTDRYDFHYVGLSFDILRTLLEEVGFSQVERVEEFGLFNDTSAMRFHGTLISLNLMTYKR